MWAFWSLQRIEVVPLNSSPNSDFRAEPFPYTGTILRIFGEINHSGLLDSHFIRWIAWKSKVHTMMPLDNVVQAFFIASSS